MTVCQVLLTIGVWVVASVISCGYAQNTDTLPKSDELLVSYNGLPKQLSQKLQAFAVDDSQIGIWVQAVDGSDPIISHQADRLFTPASTQKLISTIIALDVLGADYRWRTPIYTKGMVVNGVLYGDLVIIGQGDPSLTHQRLSTLLGQLPKKGIRHITGDIIIDNLAFEGVDYDVNAFDGQGLRPYNAQPNAFLVNFGTVEVTLTPSGYYHQSSTHLEPTFVATDDKLAVRVLPRLARFAYPKQVTTKGKACQTNPKFALIDDTLTLLATPQASCGQTVTWLAMADTDQLAIKAVQGIWQQIDPAFRSSVRLRRPHESMRGYIPIVTGISQPVSKQIYHINQYSNNVMTEQLALSLPLHFGAKSSTYAKTFWVLTQWWQTHLNHTPPIITSRASGLCRECKISPNTLGELLLFAYRQPTFDTLKASLPIAGQTGTLKVLAKRQPNHPAIGRAFIKTGMLADVVSMAGYIQGINGKWYAVVGMINTPGAATNGSVAILDELLAIITTHSI